MRKFILMVAVVMLCGVAKADVIESIKTVIPNTTPGVFYNIQSHEANFITTFELLSKETKLGTISLDGGYGETDMGIAAISYKTETLSKLGVNVLILKDLFAKVGYGIGYDHITTHDREFGQGPEATFGANIKF